MLGEPVAAKLFGIPFYVQPEKAWYFDSRDKFMLPKPFSRVTRTFGEKIKLPPLQGEADFESQRLMIQKIMQPHLAR